MHFDRRQNMVRFSRPPVSERIHYMRDIGWMSLPFVLIMALAACGGNDSSRAAPTDNKPPNQMPVFTSEIDIYVPENTRDLPAVSASDADGDPIAYSIEGGEDADRFHLDEHTGELSFKAPPDFDAPTDSNANNIYLVTVAASDGFETTRQLLAVTVIDAGLTVSVSPGHIKTLTFNWAMVPGAEHYKLYVNPDGISGYIPAGEGADIVATRTEVTIPVHLTDWANSLYMLEGYNNHGLVSRSGAEDITSFMLDTIGYIKASNAEAGDAFSFSIALSADGNTLAVGAIGESSATTGVNGNQDDNTAVDAGAVYVFVRVDGTWTQQAYLKASNAEATDWFGGSVALSADGNILAVGAIGEGSATTGVDGDQNDNTASGAGAVYVFVRVDGTWTQQAYIKASNAEEEDWFGDSVTLSTDGNILAVGATGEDSATTGVDGDQDDNTASAAGAVYVFARVDGAWTQQAYIKASNAEAVDDFGVNVALSADGNTLAIGADDEGSATTGVNGNQDDNTAGAAGAVYVFVRVEGTWTQQAYIKASNVDADDVFGISVALSTDGNTLAVGATGEDSTTTGVDGDQDDNTASGTGAVYVFVRVDGMWTQQAYIKASNAETPDWFGDSVTLSADGHTLAVGAIGENSATTGVDGNQDDNTAKDAGAVYVFVRADGTWTQKAYIKAPNAEAFDQFGDSVTLSADGNTLAVGAIGESSATTGINGDQGENSANHAGAVYLY